MTQARVPMHHTREILRLFKDLEMGVREIANSLGLSPTTVSKYTNAALNLPWPLPTEWTDTDLKRALFPKKEEVLSERYEIPDWTKVHEELKRHKGGTLQVLWEEYRGDHRTGLSYSQFCARYAAFKKCLKPSYRNTYVAGDRMLVDYAGTTVPIHSPKTGEIDFDAAIYVSILGASSYTFAEATQSQELVCWIGSHVRAFEYYGGVTGQINPDNLRSGVTNADFYEPRLNATYEEMAAHYNTAIIPTRVRRPKDKAPVENAVLIVTRWILFRLRKRKFFSLDELNKAIAILREELNDRPFQKLPGSRRSTFLAIEKPALKPLPATRYEIAQWKNAVVNIDYHIEVVLHRNSEKICYYYSVPCELIHQEVRVRSTETVVEIFFKGERVASHPRLPQNGRFSTCTEHMPKDHKFRKEWTRERFESWAKGVGSGTLCVIQAQFSERVHPEQGFRRCLGILSLAKKDSPDRLERACKKALELLGPDRHISLHILRMLYQNDRPEPAAADPGAILSHGNLREEGYFTPSPSTIKETSC